MIAAELFRLTSDQLGERIKSFYEARTRISLPRRTYTIIRCDGKGFSNYTKSLTKPFDSGFLEDMEFTAAALCKEVQGCVLAYTQSDEISLLLTDFSTPTSDAWFDGQVQKMASVAAATATGAFIAARLDRKLFDPKYIPVFDARVFSISDRSEVGAYFWWRQRDAIRNSVSMFARANFSHKELQGVSVKEMRAKLVQIDNPWEKLSLRIRQGSVIEKIQQPKETTLPNGEIISFLRNSWTAVDAPSFSGDPAYLERLIPKFPAGTERLDDGTKEGQGRESTGDNSASD